jgi:hypothetical protein
MRDPAGSFGRIILFTCLAVTVAMLLCVDHEMLAPLWGGQHDEKLTLWPARANVLGPPHSVWDFDPPGTLVFGWFGPALHRLGFLAFGLNDVGLRLPFLLCSAGSLLFFGLTCARVAPGALGLLVFLFWGLNLTTIAIGRSALLENIGTFALTFIAWLATGDREAYMRRSTQLSLACGGLALVKINFLLYAVTLHLCLVSVFAPKRLSRQLAVCALSVALWEGVHALLLQQHDFFHPFVHNLWLTILDHLGVRGEVTKYNLYQIAPSGIAFTAYQMGFWFGAWMLCWDANHPIDPHPIFAASCVAFPIALLVGLVVRLVRRRPFDRFPDTAWALTAFLLIHWLIASQFFFALKRAYPFFPIVLVLAAMLLKIVWDLGRGARIAVATALLALNAVRIERTREFLVANADQLYTRNVEENSRTLDEILPEGTEIYAYGLAARFVWMSHHRILSWDDQLKNNQMVLDEAIARHATHVLLVDPSTIPADYVGGFHPPVSVELELVHTFVTTPADSDYPMRSFLVALHPERASEGTLRQTEAP